ncbi:hypothetical protein [Clostridium tagluense]|uniref:hypothetical protein n=1 Tax=Clostridium tagluense TaxID=360422 RepID=UPI001CF1252F|nr:hypothetical protein [Clostridium tagluense]MCB2297051.1 hypothetical protein [Clostridium tagluense]
MENKSIITKNTYIEIGKELDNDWTNFIIFEWDILGEFNYIFEVKPEEFLEYAKDDIKLKEQKGLIDAMSNAKRAIECQIDSIISILGYDYKIFDSRNSYLETKKFIKEYFKEEVVDGLTDRIKLLQVLNIAPTFLISKIRNLRNKVEHEYIMPTYQEVKESIEIAELFINSSMRKISISNRAIYFGNKYGLEECEGLNDSVYNAYRIHTNYICIEIDWYKKKSIINLTFVRDNKNTLPYYPNTSENTSYVINSDDEMYPYFLKVIYTKEYDLLPRILGYDLKTEYIKYIVVEG